MMSQANEKTPFETNSSQFGPVRQTIIDAFSKRVIKKQDSQETSTSLKGGQQTSTSSKGGQQTSTSTKGGQIKENLI